MIPVDEATQSVILLMGMAVGVDYSLFYLRREREERAAGASSREALLKTAATSGQAVFVSGLTVLIAMAGMLFTGNKTFTSIGVGTMIVVAVSVVGSIMVLPALLARLGDSVNRGHIPFLHATRRHEANRAILALGDATGAAPPGPGRGACLRCSSRSRRADALAAHAAA